jgi:hypothetical protein
MNKRAQRMGAFMAPRHWWERAMRDLVLPMAVKQAIKKSSKGFGYRLHPWPESTDEAA